MAYTGPGIVFDSGMPPGFGGATTAGWTIVALADPAIGTANALKSATIAHGGNTLFNYTTPSDVNIISIRYKTDSENAYDNLRVLLDGVEIIVASGTGAGIEQYTHPTHLLVHLSPGTHTLTFRYSKDASYSTGTDAVYITEIIARQVLPATATMTKFDGYAAINPASDAAASVLKLTGSAVTGGADTQVTAAKLTGYGVTGGASTQVTATKLNAYAVIYAARTYVSFSKLNAYAVEGDPPPVTPTGTARPKVFVVT